MMKIFRAEIKDKKVVLDGAEVPQALCLSAGKADSSGVLILDGLEKVYIAIPIDSMKQILDLVAQLASTVGAGVAASNGGGPIAPTLSADMAAIVAKITLLKEELQ